MKAFSFSPADSLHDEDPRFDRENGYLYVYVRPHTPGISFSSTLVLDGVVIDLDADLRVTGFEIFPDTSRQLQSVQLPGKWPERPETMWIRRSDIEEGQISQTYDGEQRMLVVRWFPEATKVELHQLSRQVILGAVGDRVVAIYVSVDLARQPQPQRHVD